MSEPNPYGTPPGYSPPQGGYTAPQGGGYAAPQGGYTAPESGYAAPQAGYPAPGYGAPAAPAAYAAPSAYASWGQRVGAYLLDQIFMLPFTIVYVIGLVMVVSQIQPDGTLNGGGSVAAGAVLAVVGLVAMLGAAIWNRYIKGGRGQSWGKQKLGIWLVSSTTGRPIGGGMAFIRDLAHVLDGFFFIGYLWPLWDERRQTFSDKVCGTVVITAPRG